MRTVLCRIIYTFSCTEPLKEISEYMKAVQTAYANVLQPKDGKKWTCISKQI